MRCESFNAVRGVYNTCFEAIGRTGLARTHRLWGEPATGPTGLRGVGGGAVGSAHDRVTRGLSRETESGLRYKMLTRSDGHHPSDTREPNEVPS